VGPLVECLPEKSEALSSNSSTASMEQEETFDKGLRSRIYKEPK
jgi:hypothetical protein